MPKRLKSSTVVTFNIKILLPEGVDIPSIRNFLKDAISCEARAQGVDGPYASFADVNIPIQLVKKEVTYA